MVQRIGITHWAPASRARLIRSGCVIRIRTRGDTPIEAMAAVELCIASSLMWPCSQSMIIPWNERQYRRYFQGLDDEWLDDRKRTSRPVWATICAVRKDGRPRKVMIGFDPARREFRRRRVGLTALIVVGGDILGF